MEPWLHAQLPSMQTHKRLNNMQSTLQSFLSHKEQSIRFFKKCVWSYVMVSWLYSLWPSDYGLSVFFSFFSFSVYSVNEITATFRRENTQSSAWRTVPRNLQGLICFWFCSQINVTLLYWLAWERGHRLMLGTLHFFFTLCSIQTICLCLMHLPLKIEPLLQNWPGQDGVLHYQKNTKTQTLYQSKIKNIYMLISPLTAHWSRI